MNLSAPKRDSFAIRLLRSPLGALIARPWLEPVALYWLHRWFLPLSRLFAAARAAHGSANEFESAAALKLGNAARQRLDKTLEEFERRRSQAGAAEAAWEACLFSADDADSGPAQQRAAKIEAGRLNARNRYNQMRLRFAPLCLGRRVPAVAWEIAKPTESLTDYAQLVRYGADLFEPPDPPPTVRHSRWFEFHGRKEYWLRFDSPSQRMGDTLTVRVSEPLNTAPLATVIYLHGIAVEAEHWRTTIDPADQLCAMGMRVVRPEAPWHGRRVAPGKYGGEKFVATIPQATLDFFSAHVRELAVLTHWARSIDDAPVGWAGSSLGAHVARLASIKAVAWPQPLQPDAMLLLAPCGDLQAAANYGAMGRLFDSRKGRFAAGWSDDLMHKWYATIDPLDLPVTNPERILTVLGSHDNVAPYPAAAALIERLGVPPANRFVWRLGHFGMPLRLLRDPAPLIRLTELLAGHP